MIVFSFFGKKKHIWLTLSFQLPPLKGDITWPLLENAYLQEIGNVPREEDLRYFKQKRRIFVYLFKLISLRHYRVLREEKNPTTKNTALFNIKRQNDNADPHCYIGVLQRFKKTMLLDQLSVKIYFTAVI